MKEFHKYLKIQNFKSIKSLKIDLKRVNLFIGNPSSGKSNILESARLISQNGINSSTFWEDYRLENVTNLFYNNNFINPISIETTFNSATFKAGVNKNGLNLNYIEALLKNPKNDENTSKFKIEFKNHIEDSGEGTHGAMTTNIKFYEFDANVLFESSFMPFLVSPNGTNLPDIIQRNEEFKDIFKSLLATDGYRYVIEPQDKKIKILREENEELILIPYQAYSDTFRRFIFLLAVVKSNKGQALLFDEPEKNMFPFYIKNFAESIALDQENQYLITTHSPYLINSIISKTNIVDLAVNLVYNQDYQTKSIQLNEKQLDRLVDWDIDIPYNIDSLLDL